MADCRSAHITFVQLPQVDVMNLKMLKAVLDSIPEKDDECNVHFVIEGERMLYYVRKISVDDVNLSNGSRENIVCFYCSTGTGYEDEKPSMN